MEPLREGLFEITEDGRGHLLTNRCERCGLSFFPRRERCTNCLKDDQLKAGELSKNGKLHTYSIVYQSMPDFVTPYIIGYVDFEEEGVRVFSQLTGCDPEKLKVGLEMELVFEELNMKIEGKRKLIYKFRPVKC